MSDSIPEFGTPRENEERRDGGCAVIFDPVSQKYAVGEHALDGLYILFSGGVEEGEDMTEGILREVKEESGLYDFASVEYLAEAMAHYYNRAKQVNRVAHATCILVVLASTKVQETQLEAHEQFTLIWKSPEEILANWRKSELGNGRDHWIYFLTLAVNRLIDRGVDTTHERLKEVV